jgi:hypothetical protein
MLDVGAFSARELTAIPPINLPVREQIGWQIASRFAQAAAKTGCTRGALREKTLADLRQRLRERLYDQAMPPG